MIQNTTTPRLLFDKGTLKPCKSFRYLLRYCTGLNQSIINPYERCM